MPWEVIKRPESVNMAKLLAPPVYISISNPMGQNGAGRPKEVHIVIRRQKVPEIPPFLEHLSTYDALVGTGENAGTLRLIPGTRFRAGVAGGSGKINERAIVLRFPKPAAMVSAEGRFVADFDYALDWFEVTIPDALRAAPSQPAPPPPNTAKKPFVSAIADVRHDVRRGT